MHASSEFRRGQGLITVSLRIGRCQISWPDDEANMLDGKLVSRLQAWHGFTTVKRTADHVLLSQDLAIVHMTKDSGLVQVLYGRIRILRRHGSLRDAP